jgi:hypothetical protein
MPYSWDDDNDFSTSAGSGFSFHKARRSYDDVAIAKKKRTATYTFRSEFPKTQSKYPVVVGIDTTGSMQDWPRVFFDKLPLLYSEATKYLPDCEMSFQAINDFEADGEDVALQPGPFASGSQLEEIIGQLYPVGGGGGQSTESYEMFAAYNSFIEAPQALIKPVAVILGDEAPFMELPRAVAEHYGLGQGGAVTCREVFQRLHDRCEVFLVHKPYGGGDEAVLKVWREHALMSDERIITIEDPKRVVDVILGILGILTGKTALFKKELEERQTAGQARDVMGSLHRLDKTWHTAVDPTLRSASIVPGLDDIATTKGLELDEID